jgi:hypothetical protein
MGMGRPHPVMPGHRGEGAPAPDYSLFFVFTGSVKLSGWEPFDLTYSTGWKARATSNQQNSLRPASVRRIRTAQFRGAEARAYSPVAYRNAYCARLYSATVAR